MEGTLIHGRTGTGLNERTVAISGNHVQCAMAVQVLPSNNFPCPPHPNFSVCSASRWLAARRDLLVHAASALPERA